MFGLMVEGLGLWLIGCWKVVDRLCAGCQRRCLGAAASESDLPGTRGESERERERREREARERMRESGERERRQKETKGYEPNTETRLHAREAVPSESALPGTFFFFITPKPRVESYKSL